MPTLAKNDMNINSEGTELTYTSPQNPGLKRWMQDTEDDITLCVLEVMSPQRSNLVLTTHIPHCETDVLVLHSLHVET